MLRSFPVMIAALLIAGHAAAGVFVIRPGAKGNSVKFVSKAPMETFDGKTNLVSGRVSFDPADLSAPVEIVIDVDLASLDTGLALRNRHMRENHLETEKFPRATFVGKRLVEPHPDRLEPGSPAKLVVEGEFTLHGVKVKRKIPVEVTFDEVDGRPFLHVVSRFEVKLSDHDIARPKFLVLKLDDVQRIVFDVKAEIAP